MGFEPSAAQFVRTPKWGGGTRPAADLYIRDRVVLDALVAHIKALIEPGLVNWSRIDADGHKNFNLGPLEAEPAYIHMTDVVSCYEYIDHDLLASELIGLTGDDEATGAVSELLGTLMQKPIGLPQGPDSSAILADIYLSIVDRKLVRDGFSVFRLNDDYHLPIQSWPDSQRVAVMLDEYLRHIGLVINYGKTVTPARNTYAAWMEPESIAGNGEGKEEEEEEIDEGKEEEEEEEHEDDEAENDEDTGYNDDDTWAGTPRGVVMSVWAESKFAAITDNPLFPGRPEAYGQSRQVVRMLRILGRTGSDTALERLPTLITRFPHLTKEAVAYLRALVDTVHVERMVREIGRLFSGRDFIYESQRGWLLHALVPVTVVLPKDVLDVVRGEFLRGSAPWFARGRAALVLATERRLPSGDEFQQIFDAASPASRPDFIAALLLNGSSASQARAVIDASDWDPILRAIPSLDRKQWQ